MKPPLLPTFVLALLAAACGSAPSREPAGRVRALVTRPPKDTTRFEAPARASRCSGRDSSRIHGVLLRGSRTGNGVVIWLRSPDTVASGAWPLLQRGDTASPRGATVAVRYMVKEIPHGLTLDSGAVDVRRDDRGLTVVARGAGLESAIMGRVRLEASFDPVPLGTDTVPCRPNP